jgi:acetyltransferase (GNAT) family protein
MSYSYAPLGPADNGELLTLAAASNTGSDAFVVDRAPDFFALGREFGEPAYWGAYAGGRLVGCVGLTRQIRFLDGAPRDIYYLHDLRIDRAHRRSAVLHGLLLQLRRAFSGQWVFSTILDGNPHAGVLTRASRAFPAARPIGRTTHVGTALFVP